MIEIQIIIKFYLRRIYHESIRIYVRFNLYTLYFKNCNIVFSSIMYRNKFEHYFHIMFSHECVRLDMGFTV